jgi:hypothetical protein
MIDPFDRVVLLTGRGGAGTRLLSRLAVDAGVFIGHEVSRSGDSTEWAELTYRMVADVGGQRDLPRGSRYRRELRATAERILAAAPRGRSGRWGLKLPETMLVLPLFIDAFPRAQVIHLTRHPISSSLRRTHLTSRLGNPVGDIALPAAYEFCGRTAEWIVTDEPYLHNAYAWNYQVTRVLHYARQGLPATQYCELKYEDVCRHPDGAFEIIRSYLGCVDCRGTASVVVDLARTGSWDQDDPRAQTIWEICGRTAELLGYRRDGASG